LQAEEPLLTIAEISVTLAGFSSVVIALRGHGPEAWSPQDRVGLGNVLGASVAVLVGSLLPFPLTYLGGSDAWVWAVANATFGTLVLAAAGFLTYRVVLGAYPPRAPRIFWSFIASGALVAAMLLLSAVDLVFPRGPAFLLIGLIWALLAAFAQLATFVLVTWSGMTEDRE
jgi:hypothetical protein